MNQQFHNKHQTLTVTNKQAGVGQLFDWSKNFYSSHAEYKIREKVIQNELQSPVG